MNVGWYKQQRNILERPWFKDANVVLLYTYLKAAAYVTDGKYEGNIIRRGSCPTTRAEMKEATGLSFKQVDLCLKKLIGFNEIFVKGYNRFSVVTIFDYDACSISDGLFDAYEEQQRNNQSTTEEQPEHNQGITPPNYNKKEDNIYNNLISHKCLIRREREVGDVAFEIKKRYNREFEGMLPPCLRLSASTHIAVMECLRLFGLQSVDEVFAQIKSEQFSLGNNKTGFVANFTFIFTPRNYQQYLERSQLSRKKAPQKPQEAPQGTFPVVAEQQPTKAEKDAQMENERRETLKGLVEMARKAPTRTNAVWMPALMAAYNSGELDKYGIDWKPNNI